MSATQSDLNSLERELAARLQRGEHIVLCGPLGTGKSTMLVRVYRRLAVTDIPCSLWTATSSLDDITSAFALAYPHVDTETTRRRARSRLWLAADQQRGVLIMDHVTRMTTAMIGFLRRLRGGVTGLLLCFDVEKDEQRLRLRGRHFGGAFLSMPLASPRRLHGIFRRRCAGHLIRRVPRPEVQRIVETARGRVGWIGHCTDLIAHERYWSGDALHTTLLCIDTEIALQQRKLDLPLVEHLLE